MYIMGNQVRFCSRDVAGLLLAQALKKLGIPYRVFERDSSRCWRSQGWGLTVHSFSAPKIRYLLPDVVSAQIPSVLVDPVNATDMTDLTILDMSTGEPLTAMRVPGRMRLNRKKTRDLFLEGGGGVDVKWNKTVVSYGATEHGVKAVFADGSEYEGGMLVGVDGARSVVRSVLCSDKAALNILPITFLGIQLDITREEISPLLKIDPITFLGLSQAADACLFYAVMSSPEVNGTASLAPSEHRWHVQLSVSWQKRAGDISVPDSNEGRVQLLHQKLAHVWPPLKDAVLNHTTHENIQVDVLSIGDWVPLQEGWDNLDGRVTLAGDAAHTMTMFRGEGFNNAVLDAYNLVQAITQVYSEPVSSPNFAEQRKKLIDEYEQELRARGARVVLASREQCMRVHNWEEYIEWTRKSTWGIPHEQPSP